MSLPYEEVERLKREIKELFNTNTIGISKVYLHCPNADEDTRDDFCIHIGLYSPPSDGNPIPSEYKGVRIFVEVIDRIVAQAN